MNELSGPPSIIRQRLRAFDPAGTATPTGGPARILSFPQDGTPCRFIAADVVARVTLRPHLDVSSESLLWPDAPHRAWNTANDVNSNGSDSHPPSLRERRPPRPEGVFRAIGALSVTANAPARPIDILVPARVGELHRHGVNPTAQQYANLLNAIYPSASYTATQGGRTTELPSGTARTRSCTTRRR